MTEPITPARFSAALPSLPLSSLALKLAEIRNSLVHLKYSNEQLLPFAYPPDPDTLPHGQQASDGQRPVGDPVCIEAIQENEVVIQRMETRLELVRQEVERRGHSWEELEGVLKELAPVQVNGHGGGATVVDGDYGEAELTNGHVAHPGTETGPAGEAGRHPAWTDGTFQTGTISGGVVVANQSRGEGQGRQGGTLGDEELRRRLEEQMHAAEVDEDEGMHL